MGGQGNRMWAEDASGGGRGERCYEGPPCTWENREGRGAGEASSEANTWWGEDREGGGRYSVTTLCTCLSATPG